MTSPDGRSRDLPASSQQALANWLHHGWFSEDQVTSSAEKRWAAVVDRQNAGDPLLPADGPRLLDGCAFQARLRIWC